MDKRDEILRCINRIVNAMEEIIKYKEQLHKLIGAESNLVQILSRCEKTVYVTSGIDTIADACGCTAKIEDSGLPIERKEFTYRGIRFNQRPKIERKEYD